MRTAVHLLLILAAVLVLGADSCGTTSDTQTTVDQPAAAANDDSSDEDPKPKLSSDLTCSYELGEIGASGGFENMRIIAGGKLTNEGNVGVKARVTFTWDMVGQPDYKVKKTYRVRKGETREVDYSEHVDQSFINAHQAGSQDCTPRARIVETLP